MTTAPRSPSAPPSRASRRLRIIVLAVIVAIAILAGLVLWYFFLRPGGPPPVGPGAPLIPIASPAA